MPDTGAPWNIPYVESTDLVSDWPTDSLALANAIDAGLDAAGNAGIGSNVVSTVKDDTFSTTSSSYTDVTGLSVTITPTSATSKILVVANVAVGSDTSNTPMLMLSDGSNNELVVPASPGSRSASFTTFYSNSGFWMIGQPFVLLHSPATASPFTYKIRMRVSGNTHYINRTQNDANNSGFPRGVSTITAIEVSA